MDVAAVFGASGGIGAALCEALGQRGFRKIYAGSRSGDDPANARSVPFRFDLGDEESIASACNAMRDDPPELVIVASGVLTLGDGTGPEKSYRQIERDAMLEAFALNSVGPALIAKHILSLLPRDRRAVFAAISARVGSITDNRLGGWHSYRASKAALNMLIRNFAIEIGRTHEQAVVVALHPGTVDTRLSEPFQGSLPEGQLTEPGEAAQHLLKVIDRLEPGQSGSCFDWKGERIPA